MSTGTGEAELLTLLLHAGLFKRFVEWTNFIFILVNMLRKDRIVFSSNKLYWKLFIVFPVISQKDNKDRQAVWHLEFIHNPKIQRFSGKSLDFVVVQKKLHLMI